MRPVSACGDYHGQLKMSRVINGLTLMEATYAPALILPKHSHPRASLCLILQGGYIESYGKLNLECKPLHIKFQPAEESHSDCYGTREVRSFIIELDHHWMKRLQTYAVDLHRPMVFRNSLLVCLVTKLRKEFQLTDDVTPLAIEGLMLEVVAETSRSWKALGAQKQAPWLERVKAILGERFSEPLSLSELAESVAVHPVYLASAFRQRFHCSIGEYLRQLRIEFACQRISTTHDSLVEVALAAGFSNQSHFSRIFKRYTGMTPAQYRATFRKA